MLILGAPYGIFATADGYLARLSQMGSTRPPSRTA